MEASETKEPGVADAFIATTIFVVLALKLTCDDPADYSAIVVAATFFLLSLKLTRTAADLLAWLGPNLSHHPSSSSDDDDDDDNKHNETTSNKETGSPFRWGVWLLNVNVSYNEGSLGCVWGIIRDSQGTPLIAFARALTKKNHVVSILEGMKMASKLNLSPTLVATNSRDAKDYVAGKIQ